MGGYAQQALDTILNSIRTRDTRDYNNKTLALQQQNSDREDEYRKAQIEQAKQELADRQKQFSVTSKAAQALHDLQIAESEQAISATATKTGITPASVQTIPATQSTPEQPLVLKDLQQNKLIFPSGNVTSVPTPTDYATQQANIARITGAPAEETKKRELEAAQQAELKRMLQQESTQGENRLKEINLSQTYENDRQTRQLAAQRAIEGMRTNAQLQVARINASGGLGLDGNSSLSIGPDGRPQVNPLKPSDIFSNAMDDATNLRLSSDEFKKRYGKQAPILENMLRNNGIGFLDKNKMDQFSDLNSVTQVLPMIQNLVKLRAQYPTEAFVPGTDAYKAYQTGLDEVGRVIPKIVTTLANVKRYNPKEAEAYLNSIIPRRNPFSSDASSGPQKFNNFVTDLQNGARTILNQLPKQHQDIAIQNLGLNNYPYLNNLMQQPGASVPSPQGATPAGSKIIVKRKSDGQVGTIDASDFNDKVYSKVGGND